jgi:hypothetical protein
MVIGVGESDVSFWGVQSPPLRGRFAEGALAEGVQSGLAESRFSRRDALCASALQGPTDGKDFHYRPRLRKRPVVEWEYTRTGLDLHCGRAEPAPPRGTSPARMAVRGKVGDDAEAVFSEGRGLRARVARPYASPGMA